MFPSNRGGYAINTVPTDITNRTDRLLFLKNGLVRVVLNLKRKQVLPVVYSVMLIDS